MDDNGAADSPEVAEPQSLGKRMQQARERAGLSAKELAERLGRTPVTLSRWENDRQVPEDADIEAYARAVGVPAIALLRSAEELRQGQEHLIAEAEARGYDRAMADMRGRLLQLLDDTAKDRAPHHDYRPRKATRAKGA